MESVHIFVLEYKSNCQNEPMIKIHQKRWPFECDLNHFKLKGDVSNHIVNMKYISKIY